MLGRCHIRKLQAILESALMFMGGERAEGHVQCKPLSEVLVVEALDRVCRDHLLPPRFHAPGEGLQIFALARLACVSHSLLLYCVALTL